MFRDSPLFQAGAANLFWQANSGKSQEEVRMTIVKAIFALILALGAITSTVNTFGGELRAAPPTCLPCGE
jgi:hypothetical protein